jgi:hypothetical protein
LSYSRENDYYILQTFFSHFFTLFFLSHGIVRGSEGECATQN